MSNPAINRRVDSFAVVTGADDTPSITRIQVDDVARTCHEANRGYCQAIGDSSQPSWDDAPDWQKESARNGVVFHLTHPRASAAASHESWLAEKERDGWTYGPVKDPEKKEHPCFVPFDQLPIEQQRKDFIFRSIVHAFVESAGK